MKAQARAQQVQAEWDLRWPDPTFQRQLALYLRRGRQDTTILSAYVDNRADARLLVDLYRSLHPNAAMELSVEVLASRYATRTQVEELLRSWRAGMGPGVNCAARPLWNPPLTDHDRREGTCLVEARDHGQSKSKLLRFLDLAQQEYPGLQYEDALTTRMARPTVGWIAFRRGLRHWRVCLRITGVPADVPKEVLRTIIEQSQVLPPVEREVEHDLFLTLESNLRPDEFEWPAELPTVSWLRLSDDQRRAFLPLVTINAYLDLLGQACGGSLRWVTSRREDVDWFGIATHEQEDVLRAYDVSLSWLSASRLLLLLLRPYLYPWPRRHDRLHPGL